MLRVIFYHVGKGDMSLVLLPSGDAMMIDCYRADQVANAEALNEDQFLDRVEAHILEHRVMLAASNRMLIEAVAKERAKTKKVPIAVLVITHADRDHISDQKKLKERFDIGQLVDSGRDYADPSDATKDYLAFRKEMRDANKYIAFARPATNIWPKSGALIDVLCPTRDIAADEDNNNQCLVLRVEYAGRVFLFTGDSPLDDWVADDTGILHIHDAKVPAHVLNVSHHGSRSFFTPAGARPEGQPEYKKEEYDTRALKRISPQLSFITCSDDEEADHPHPIALELYEEHTNPTLPGGGSSHVILSRYSQHLHHVVDADGRMYMRTSRSRTNRVQVDGQVGGPYLEGRVSSTNGFLHRSGIWVSRLPLDAGSDISFTVEAKGKWTYPISFDWWVLNNGQDVDDAHREYYTMESKDRKKISTWRRELKFAGVHIMQCYASADNGKEWANWCVLVCQEASLPIAERWIEIFPGCINPNRINH